MVYTTVTEQRIDERGPIFGSHSENLLRNIIDAIPTQAWCLHSDGRVNYLNQRWHDYAGVSRGEAYRSPIGADATDVARRILHPDDAPAFPALSTSSDEPDR